MFVSIVLVRADILLLVEFCLVDADYGIEVLDTGYCIWNLKSGHKIWSRGEEGIIYEKWKSF